MYQFAVTAAVLLTNWNPKHPKLARVAKLAKYRPHATSVALLFAVATVWVVLNASNHLHEVLGLQYAIMDAYPGSRAQSSDEQYLKLVRPGPVPYIAFASLAKLLHKCCPGACAPKLIVNTRLLVLLGPSPCCIIPTKLLTLNNILMQSSLTLHPDFL